MSKLEKFAVLNLILSSVGLMIMLIRFLVNIYSFKIIVSVLAFVLCSFLMASYIFRYKFQKQGSQYYDERDKLIHKKAVFAGFITMFLILFVSSFLTFLIFLPDNSISIGLLLGIVSLSYMSVFFAESIAILVQYGWENKGE